MSVAAMWHVVGTAVVSAATQVPLLAGSSELTSMRRGAGRARRAGRLRRARARFEPDLHREGLAKLGQPCLFLCAEARRRLHRTTGPPRSPEGCRDPRSTRGQAPHTSCAGPARFSGADSDRACRQIDVTTWMPTGVGGGFDDEIGLTYLEVTPDGAQAQLHDQRQALQPHGIVHGGVYCSIVESVASVSAATWLQSNGGGRQGRRGQQQHRLPARHHRGHGHRGRPRRSTAAGASSCGSSRSPTPTTSWSRAARCGCRTCRPRPRPRGADSRVRC